MTGRARRKRVRWALVGVAGLSLSVLLLPNLWVWGASAGRVSDAGDVDETVRAPVAIVLGASVYSSGDPSPWLRYRLDIAASLYESGQVDSVLVSGDNGQMEYNEPIVMHDYLVSVGVPDEAIAVDYAGFDTYDTCVRAHDVFGVSQAVLVSQDFHVSRAVALCRAAGIDAVGVGDTKASGDRGMWARSWMRERIAAVKAAWDVISRREPLLGKRETTVDDAIAWTRAQRADGADAAAGPGAQGAAEPTGSASGEPTGPASGESTGPAPGESTEEPAADRGATHSAGSAGDGG